MPLVEDRRRGPDPRPGDQKAHDQEPGGTGRLVAGQTGRTQQEAHVARGGQQQLARDDPAPRPNGRQRDACRDEVHGDQPELAQHDMVVRPLGGRKAGQVSTPLDPWEIFMTP